MYSKTFALASLLALTIAGCGDNNPPTTPTKPSTPAPATNTAPAPAMPPMGMPAMTMPMSMPMTMPMSMPAMSMPAMSMPAMSMPAASMPAMSRPAMSMPATSMPAATMAASVPAATASLTSTADGLLVQATQAIKDKKWDIADAAVTQLDKYKPNLPAEYGPRIDQVKTLLDGAKALTQPGIPNLPRL